MGRYWLPRTQSNSGIMLLGMAIVLFLLSSLGAYAGTGLWGVIPGVGNPDTDVNIPIYLQLTTGQAFKADFTVTINPVNGAPPMTSALGWHTTIGVTEGIPLVESTPNTVHVIIGGPTTAFDILTAPTDASSGRIGYVTARIPASAVPGQSYSITVSGNAVDPDFIGFTPGSLDTPNGIGVQTTLTVSGSHGIVTVDGVSRNLPYIGSFAPWDTLRLSAIADADYRFGSWAGDLNGTNPDISILMNNNKAISANFIREYFFVVVKIGNGSVQMDGVPLNLPYAELVDEGSSITLQATPDPDWQFTGWTGDINGTDNPITFSVTGGKTVTANFVRVPCIISGRVTLNGIGIPGVYMDGLPSPVVTDVDGNYSMSVPYGWSGTVTPLLTDTSFNPASQIYTDVINDRSGQDYAATELCWLTLTSYGGDNPLFDIGSVSVNGEVHALTSVWVGQFPKDSSVTLWAIPEPGWRFLLWWEEGQPERTANPITIEMTQGRNISVDFVPIESYLVGDVTPELVDTDGDGMCFGLGEFGDNNLQTGGDLMCDDVATTILGWSAFGSYPPPGTVMFDLMDSYPIDTRKTRGGDGRITWGDVITTYDRCIDPSLARPCRTVLPTNVAIASGALVASSDSSLTISPGAAAPGDTVWLPLTLELGKKSADRFGFCIDLIPDEGAPLATVLDFVPAEELPIPDVNEPAGPTLVVAWLNRLPAATKSAFLGYVRMTIPETAQNGDRWSIHCTAAGASSGATELALQPVDGSIQAVQTTPHDVAVTEFAVPTSGHIKKPVTFTVTVANQTMTMEQSVAVTIWIRRADGSESSLSTQIITLAGLSSMQVGFPHTFTPTDIPGIMLWAQVTVAGDTDINNDRSSIRSVTLKK